MTHVRKPGRVVLPLWAAVLLLLSACATERWARPPLGLHDGLAARIPAPWSSEYSVGYHRVLAPAESEMLWEGDFGFASGRAAYIIGAVRLGLERSPLAMEVGLTSTVILLDVGYVPLCGLEAGVGYQGPDLSVVCRVNCCGFNVPWAQASFLVGTGQQADPVQYTLGGRLCPDALGPVAFITGALGRVDLRLETSHMLPLTARLDGPVTSLGFTVAATAR